MATGSTKASRAEHEQGSGSHSADFGFRPTRERQKELHVPSSGLDSNCCGQEVGRRISLLHQALIICSTASAQLSSLSHCCVPKNNDSSGSPPLHRTAGALKMRQRAIVWPSCARSLQRPRPAAVVNANRAFSMSTRIGPVHIAPAPTLTQVLRQIRTAPQAPSLVEARMYAICAAGTVVVRGPPLKQRRWQEREALVQPFCGPKRRAILIGSAFQIEAMEMAVNSSKVAF